MGLNRVAVGDVCRTMTQGSSCLATLGYGTESRWDSRTERDSASRSRFANTEMVGCFRRTLHAEVLRVADQLCSACKTPAAFCLSPCEERAGREPERGETDKKCLLSPA